MQPGDLAPRSEFWVNYSINVGADEELELDTSEPEDELIHLFLKNHKLVADGYANKRKNQFVQFVLFNPEEKAAEENQKTDVVAHAYSLLFSMSHMEMLDALQSTGKKVQSTHPEMVKQQLTAVVQKNPVAFVNMLSDKNYQVKLFILKCVARGVLVKTKNNVDQALFYYNDEYLGLGITEVVDKLQTNQAQGIYIGMKSALDQSYKKDMVDNGSKSVAATPTPAPSYSKTPAPKELVPQEIVEEEKVEIEAYVPPVESNGKAPIDVAAIAKSKAKAPRKVEKKVIKGAAGLKAKSEISKIDPVNIPKAKVKPVKAKGGNTTDNYDNDDTVI